LHERPKTASFKKINFRDRNNNFIKFLLYLQPCPVKQATDGAVAQLVEQRTENPCVGGSIPPHTTYFVQALIVKALLRPFLFLA
jgi:hypothetical protein